MVQKTIIPMVTRGWKKYFSIKLSKSRGCKETLMSYIPERDKQRAADASTVSKFQSDCGYLEKQTCYR